MTQTHKPDPEANAGGFEPLALPRYGDKRAVADMLGLSRRTIDNLLRDGCPHLKLGARRVRFDMSEVASWLRERYGCQRLGKLTTEQEAA